MCLSSACYKILMPGSVNIEITNSRYSQYFPFSSYTDHKFTQKNNEINHIVCAVENVLDFQKQNNCN